MSLAALTAALEIEIRRLRRQVAELPAGSIDHARVANTLAKHERDLEAARRLLSAH